MYINWSCNRGPVPKFRCKNLQKWILKRMNSKNSNFSFKKSVQSLNFRLKANGKSPEFAIEQHFSELLSMVAIRLATNSKKFQIEFNRFRSGFRNLKSNSKTKFKIESAWTLKRPSLFTKATWQVTWARRVWLKKHLEVDWRTQRVSSGDLTGDPKHMAPAR